MTKLDFSQVNHTLPILHGTSSCDCCQCSTAW